MTKAELEIEIMRAGWDSISRTGNNVGDENPFPAGQGCEMVRELWAQGWMDKHRGASRP